MSLREWSARIPMILQAPGGAAGQTVAVPVSQVDVLPTLVRLAADATGAVPPDPVDPLDGRDLVALAEGSGEDAAAIAEYLAEGTGQPMLMIRDGQWKYICCPGDPEQLFDLEADPAEMTNLVGDPEAADILIRLRSMTSDRWDYAEFDAQVRDSQARRLVVYEALRQGGYYPWDYQPLQKASERYMRNHMDLNVLEDSQRFPRGE